MKIIIATGNEHKRDEIKAFLNSDYDVFTMKEEGIYLDIVEDGSTFEENALIKARSLRQFTEEIIIADDSGLEVHSLGGQPGVYSARYAGDNATDEENNQKLLQILKESPLEQREATFVSVIAVIMPGGQEYTVRGECTGLIGFEYQGTNGFGYDPLFIVDGTEKTFAQMTSKEKNMISHRAKALQKLSELLTTLQN